MLYIERGNRVGRDAILNIVKEGLTENMSFKQRSEGYETWMWGGGGEGAICQTNCTGNSRP